LSVWTQCSQNNAAFHLYDLLTYNLCGEINDFIILLLLLLYSTGNFTYAASYTIG
jgi:hypothetical protein